MIVMYIKTVCKKTNI